MRKNKRIRSGQVADMINEHVIGLKYDEVVGTYNGTWDECYWRGYREPRYPMPAIPLKVVWTPSIDDPFHDTIVIYTIGEPRPCCGNTKILVALFDYDDGRCFNWFLPIGEYVNARQFEEGVRAGAEFIISDTKTQ